MGPEYVQMERKGQGQKSHKWGMKKEKTRSVPVLASGGLRAIPESSPAPRVFTVRDGHRGQAVRAIWPALVVGPVCAYQQTSLDCKVASSLTG